MVKKFIGRYHYLIYMGLSFYVIDLYLRYLNLDINFGGLIALSASFFTLSWATFFMGTSLLLKAKIKKVFYLIIISFFYIMLVVNYFYFMIFNSFFSFKNLALAGEGTNYFTSVLAFISLPFILVFMVGIILIFLGLKFIPKDNIKLDKAVALFLILLSVISFFSGRYFLGPLTDKLAWDAWNHKRNVYDSFMESRKSLQVSGFYEYIIRDLYLSYLKKEKISEDDVIFVEEYFNNYADKKQTNEWTGIFKDKNLVLVLMESIDGWLITENTMPTVYKLMNEGVNFSNHFSPIYGGGATFNSEFMVNTGFMTPFNGGNAAYMFVDNIFPHSLPRLFKEKGYTANMFHLNHGRFYNRTEMSKVFGYENYHGSYEMGISPNEAVRDSHFMTNRQLRDLIIPDNNFFSFILTYSVHTPYTKNAIECSANLTEEDNVVIDNNEEMTCIRAQARETDKLFELLIEELHKDNKLDDTVIVAFSDHYPYGFTDRKTLMELKGASDHNFIHHTPFFIWHNNMEPYEVRDVSANIDILPTIADLFDLNWHPKDYLGQNVLNNNYDGFVLFADYSWYDGEVYYHINNVAKGENVSLDYINKRNSQISHLLRLNKAVLETNYFAN